MPFPSQTPLSFTKESVSTLTANQDGCYGIFGADNFAIYIGKGDLRNRLLAHVNGDNTCILKHEPLVAYTVVTAAMDATEKTLITELIPVCNERVG